MRRIGIFGGTFNPIHLGHLRSAEEIREVYGLDEVRFLPAAIPPHKGAGEVAPPADRLRMVELAIADHPAFRTSALELERGGPSYSVDTLRTLRSELGAQTPLFFIVGLDAFRELDTWKEPEEIFRLADLIVTSRPGAGERLAHEELPIAAQKAFCYDADSGRFRHESGHLLMFQPITALGVSATAVRNLLRQQRSVRYLVPPAVEAYIAEHGLYRGGNASR